MKHKYIEIVAHDSEKVIKRYDVSLMSETGADTVENGCNDTINPNENFVRRVKCETELETGVL